jgi:hypothetical protein
MSEHHIVDSSWCAVDVESISITIRNLNGISVIERGGRIFIEPDPREQPNPLTDLQRLGQEFDAAERDEMVERQYSKAELASILYGHAANCEIEGVERLPSIFRQAANALSALPPQPDVSALVAALEAVQRLAEVRHEGHGLAAEMKRLEVMTRINEIVIAALRAVAT